MDQIEIEAASGANPSQKKNSPRIKRNAEQWTDDVSFHNITRESAAAKYEFYICILYRG